MNFDQVLSNFNSYIDQTYSDLGANLQNAYVNQMQATVDDYMAQARSRYQQMADSAISTARNQIESSRQTAMSQLEGVTNSMRVQGYSDDQINQFRGQIEASVNERLQPVSHELDSFEGRIRDEISTMYGQQQGTTGINHVATSDSSFISVNPISQGGTSAASGVDINISYNELESNLSRLKSGLNNLKSNWEGVIQTNIAKLEQSWIGDDCSAYITKLKESDTKVKKSIEAIQLLITTYTQALEVIKANQASVTNTIAGSN